jgi:hypothetical protein
MLRLLFLAEMMWLSRRFIKYLLSLVEEITMYVSVRDNNVQVWKDDSSSSTASNLASVLFRFRINSETMNALDTWNSFLEGRSAHRKVSAYIGRHSTEKRRHTLMFEAEFEPVSQCYHGLWSYARCTVNLCSRLLLLLFSEFYTGLALHVFGTLSRMLCN